MDVERAEPPEVSVQEPDVPAAGDLLGRNLLTRLATALQTRRDVTFGGDERI
jgi:hypothetical protein